MVSKEERITDFLIVECNRCGNEIHYRLRLDKIKDVEEYIQQLKNKQQKVIDKLQHDNEVDNIAVKKLEEKRRTATSEYYKNSYQKQIHKLNVKIEMRKEILKILKGEE